MAPLARNGPGDWVVWRCRRHHQEKTARDRKGKGPVATTSRRSRAKVDSETVAALTVIGVAVVAVGAPARLLGRVGQWWDAVHVDVGQLQVWAAAFLSVLAVAVLFVFACRFAASRRAGARDRLRLVVARAANTDPDHLELSHVKWSHGSPVSGRVHYSPALDDSPGSAARKGVEQVVARKVGAPLVYSWEPSKDTVRWSRGVPEPVAAPETPTVVTSQQKRLVAALSSAVRGDVTLAVGDVDGQGPVEFTVTYPDTVRDDADTVRAAVQDVINAKLPGRYKLAWDTEANRVTAHRRPPMPFPVPHPAPDGDDQWRIPFGVDEHGDPAVWNLREAPHLLVVGSTGSGKTALLSGLIAEASHRGFDVHIIDGKGTALAGFRGWPSVKGHGLGEPEDMSDAMLTVEEIMRDRYRQVRDHGAEPGDFDPVLCVLDEAAEFSTNVAAWWKAEKTRGAARDAPALQSWKAIARLGRECRVHLVLGIQQAAADFLGGTEGRDNFGLRVACGPVTEQGARMAFGRSDVGRDVPANPKGRATVATMGGDPVEVQVFWTPAPRPNGAIRDDDKAILGAFL